jgi:hypothetical protein
MGENDASFRRVQEPSVATGDAHSTHREAAFDDSTRNYLAALV